MLLSFSASLVELDSWCWISEWPKSCLPFIPTLHPILLVLQLIFTWMSHRKWCKWLLTDDRGFSYLIQDSSTVLSRSYWPYFTLKVLIFLTFCTFSSYSRLAWCSVGMDKIQASKVQNFDCTFSYVEAHKAAFSTRRRGWRSWRSLNH